MSPPPIPRDVIESAQAVLIEHAKQMAVPGSSPLINILGKTQTESGLADTMVLVAVGPSAEMLQRVLVGLRYAMGDRIVADPRSDAPELHREL